MKPMFSVITALLAGLTTSVCFAAPTLATPAATNVGANMATLVLKSGGTGTGYFTLLYENSASCGTGTQVKAGQTASGAVAPYFGSLPLTADTDSYYTIRNLTRDTAYTVCFTADSPSGSPPNPAPLATNLTTSAATAFTGLDWSEVGNAGFSAGTANASSLVFAPDGTPYVAFGDEGNDNKATVMKFSDDAWITVGNTGFSAGMATSTSLAFAPDGTPHLVYSDYGNGSNGKATVMKLNGGSWNVVGSAGFSADIASSPSLAFAPDGTPYVAFGGDDYNNTRATVMRFSADTWSLVGSAGFSAGTAYSTSLAFAPDGTPYVAYSDYGNSGKVTVMKFSGSSWINVGSPGFSAFDAGFTSLAISPDGTPHVAYSDYGNGGNATVMKFSGSVWSEVGIAGFSGGTANSTSLAFAPDGTPCVAYSDAGSTGRTMVMQYSTGTWNVVGSAEFSAGTATSTSLAFAPNGTPYVAYGDGANGSRATVMQLKNPLSISGTPAAGAIIGAPYSFTPTATHADSFSITGTLPPGINFNTTTGSLSGTPTAIGIYSTIVISASNPLGSVSLPAFSITVTSSTVPDTTITSTPPANPTTSTSFLFTFTSTEPGSSFECSLQNEPFGLCSSPYSNSIVYAQCTTCRTDTAVNFAVRAKGPGGDIDPTPASSAWTIKHTIGTLFDSVLDGGTVQLEAIGYTGALTVNRGAAFTLKGGYDSGYATNNGLTSIQGTITISAGRVTFENIVIM